MALARLDGHQVRRLVYREPPRRHPIIESKVQPADYWISRVRGVCAGIKAVMLAGMLTGMHQLFSFPLIEC